MAVYPDRIIKCLYIFKYNPVCMAVIHYLKPVDPFPFYQGVEAFYAGVVPWAGFCRITAFHPLGCFLIISAGILYPAVAMDASGCSTCRSSFAFLTASSTHFASSVSPSVQDMIFREYRSIILARYTNPTLVHM